MVWPGSKLYWVWNYISQVLLLCCKEVAWVDVLIQFKFITIIEQYSSSRNKKVFTCKSWCNIRVIKCFTWATKQNPMHGDAVSSKFSERFPGICYWVKFLFDLHTNIFNRDSYLLFEVYEKTNFFGTFKKQYLQAKRIQISC